MIISCPNCKGRVAISVFTQYSDGKCSMCDGQGKVDTESICSCGRPAVRLSGIVMTCTNQKCVDKALGTQDTKPNGSIQSFSNRSAMSCLTGDDDMSDEERYAEWFGRHMY